MPSEYCPRCRSVTSMTVTESERRKQAADGTENTVVTKTNHCSRCHTYVRSEEVESEAASKTAQ